MDWLNLENRSIGSFRLCKAIHIPTYGREIDQYRCDAIGWGPVGINWKEDGDMFGSESATQINHLHDYRIVMDCAPYFYITYNRFNDTDGDLIQESNVRQRISWDETPETVAPTLPHLIRLLIEWDAAFHDPFNNNDPICQLSHQALSVLSMTPTIRGYFMKNYPPMPVERFLLNDTKAKDVPEDGTLTKSIENYLNKILEKFPPRSPIQDLWTTNVEMPENGHETFV